ncbi:MAG: hypothetical protein ACSHXG_15655 [Maribacter stanieri]
MGRFFSQLFRGLEYFVGEPTTSPWNDYANGADVYAGLVGAGFSIFTLKFTSSVRGEDTSNSVARGTMWSCNSRLIY